jgi:hypothetical protein
MAKRKTLRNKKKLRVEVTFNNKAIMDLLESHTAKDMDQVHALFIRNQEIRQLLPHPKFKSVALK